MSGTLQIIPLNFGATVDHLRFTSTIKDRTSKWIKRHIVARLYIHCRSSGCIQHRQSIPSNYKGYNDGQVPAAAVRRERCCCYRCRHPIENWLCSDKTRKRWPPYTICFHNKLSVACLNLLFIPLLFVCLSSFFHRAGSVLVERPARGRLLNYNVLSFRLFLFGGYASSRLPSHSYPISSAD